MNSAVSRIRHSLAARRAARLDSVASGVTFDEVSSQVCDNRCRADAQRHRTQAASIHGAF